MDESLGEKPEVSGSIMSHKSIQGKGSNVHWKGWDSSLRIRPLPDTGWVKLFIIDVTLSYLSYFCLADCPAAPDRGNQCHVLPAHKGDPEHDSDWGKPHFWVCPRCGQGAEDSPRCAELAQTEAEPRRGTWQHTKGDKYVHPTPFAGCQGSKQGSSSFLLSDYEAGGLLIMVVEISPATKSPSSRTSQLFITSLHHARAVLLRLWVKLSTSRWKLVLSVPSKNSAQAAPCPRGSHISSAAPPSAILASS